MISDARRIPARPARLCHDASLRAGEIRDHGRGASYARESWKLLRQRAFRSACPDVPGGLYRVHQALERIAYMEELEGDMPDGTAAGRATWLLNAFALHARHGPLGTHPASHERPEKTGRSRSGGSARVEGCRSTTSNEFVTLASIVERGDRPVPDERSRVRVWCFINRLNRGMRLQSVFTRPPSTVSSVARGLPPGRAIYRSDIDMSTEYQHLHDDGLPSGRSPFRAAPFAGRLSPIRLRRRPLLSSRMDRAAMPLRGRWMSTMQMFRSLARIDRQRTEEAAQARQKRKPRIDRRLPPAGNGRIGHGIGGLAQDESAEGGMTGFARATVERAGIVATWELRSL